MSLTMLKIEGSVLFLLLLSAKISSCSPGCLNFEIM
ncbi:MAG: hypothetical protein CM15mP95_3070 [Alphaproteobacteria bacterium]|nr:MAG: hypothetical protein CM15mP95_3070 [Alphaproteobacteria bacterium]